MWWLAATGLYRSALSGDQLILVVKRVCRRVQSQLRIGLSICWLPTYDGTFQGDLSAPPHIQKGCCGLARRTVCEHTLPQRFCVDTFWTRQHVIPALRKIRSELRLRRRVKPFFFLALSIGRVCFWQHMFFCLAYEDGMGLSNEVNRTQSESHSLASQFVVAPFIRLKCVTLCFCIGSIQ